MAAPTELVLRTADVRTLGERPQFTVTLDGVHHGKQPFGSSHRQDVAPGTHQVEFEAHFDGDHRAYGRVRTEVEVGAEARTTVTYEITALSKDTVRGETRVTTGDRN